MIKAIHHVALVTRDLDRILAFYRDALGFKQVVSGGWSTKDETSPQYDRVVDLKGSSAIAVMVHAGNVMLEFFQYHSPEACSDDTVREANMPGWRHISFDVTNIDEIYEKMIRSGATFSNPPQDLGFVKAVYGRDPDGNLIELQELVGPDNPMELHISVPKPMEAVS